MKYLALKLLLINVAVFILELIFPLIIPIFALNPPDLLSRPYMLITAMFLHSTTVLLADGSTIINLNHLFQRSADKSRRIILGCARLLPGSTDGK